MNENREKLGTIHALLLKMKCDRTGLGENDNVPSLLTQGKYIGLAEKDKIEAAIIVNEKIMTFLISFKTSYPEITIGAPIFILRITLFVHLSSNLQSPIKSNANETELF